MRTACHRVMVAMSAIGMMTGASAKAADAVAEVPQPAIAAAPTPSAPPAEASAPIAVSSAPTVPTVDSVAGGDRIDRVQVTDAFIELHTFPGRGYPVFFVAARGEWIAIELRHTDWFKVRTAGGKQGWVHRSQLATTLAEAGGGPNFRDVLLDDYLARHVELGAAYGRFHSEPLIKFWLSYRMSDTLSLEATLGQVQGVFSGTTLWHVNLQAEPWSDQRFSPFAGIGVGRFKNVPNQSLIAFTTTNAHMADAVVGARYHLGDRFVIRADYTIYTAFVSDQRSIEYRAATAGLSFFF